MAGKKRNGEYKNCPSCKKQFWVRKSYIVSGRGVFCSRKCQKNYIKKYQKCWICKNIFPWTIKYFYKNKIKKNNLSDDCRTCRKKKTHISYLKQRQRRKDLIKSFENKCQKCGIFNENHSFFDIDHIVPIFITKNKRKIYQYDDMSNLQILCPNCHRIKTINDKQKTRQD